jgi:antitoxin (DNA-binding transcriptional repressor) of toxin-antitoxin stability system
MYNLIESYLTHVCAPVTTLTATELARNLRTILDQLAAQGGEFVIERNHLPIARMTPMPPHRTALTVLADLYRTLPEDAAQGWLEDGRQALGEATAAEGLRDPWAPR